MMIILYFVQAGGKQTARLNKHEQMGRKEEECPNSQAKFSMMKGSSSSSRRQSAKSREGEKS
jgi:hypothetical protein